MESNHVDGISGRRHVVALPFPGRGHINPMMSLCRLLASRGLLITFVVTEEWQSLLASSSSAPPPPNLRLCSIPDVLPSERTRGADYGAFIRAVLTKMEAPVEELLQGLHPPADAIIADSLMPWAAAIAGRRRIPVSALFPQAAAVFLALQHLADLDDGGQSAIDLLGKENEWIKYIPIASSTYLDNLFANSNSLNILRKFIQAISWSTTAQSLLFTTFHELESNAIDTLRSKLQLPIHPIGPSIPYTTTFETEDTDSTNSYYKWLDSQPQGSVLYVSLGSFLPISSDQMIEIATGLRMSGVRFLWVSRGESESMKMTANIGLVVPWCDQLKVLCHSSVGGFMTHCGWNSTLEAMFAGVPMLTFPLMWDQYPNSKLIVEDWKIGLRLKEEKGGDVGREEIVRVVRMLMDLDTEESKEMRRKSQEFKELCRKTIGDEGSLSTNLDDFLREVVQMP